MNNNLFNRIPLIKIALTGFLLLSAPVHAEINADVKRCAKIENDKNRLECFDTVAAYYKTFASAPKSIPKPPDAVIKAVPAQDIAPSQLDKKEARQKIITSEDAFGKSSAEITQIESLKSNIVGKFGGWKKGKTLKLKNGQKWKVVSRTTGYVKLENPAVEITRGVFGSFNMKVEGLNAVAKVRRVD